MFRNHLIIKQILCIFLCVFSPLLCAKPNWMHSNAPDVYIVKKGDTLWDIAGIFTHEPWRWQEIWAANPAIQNPNYIYPGDRIHLRYDANGHPRLHLHRADTRQAKEYWQDGEKVIKLSPGVRSQPAEGAVPTIPTSVIQPFFNRSLVVSPAHVESCPDIVALDEDHLVVGTGDRIYATGVFPDSPAALYSIFRADKSYVHPVTEEILGVEGLVLGKAQIELMGDPASLVVRNSYYEIRVGDKLIEPMQEDVEAFFYPKSPTGDPLGQIISVFDGLTQIGQYQVVVITGGIDQHREIGDVLAVYQNQKDLPSRMKMSNVEPYDFPSLKIARLVLFRVFDKVSYGLVMSATRPIYIKDQVGSP